MVLTFEQEIAFEKEKQLGKERLENNRHDHAIEELNLMLEIAKAGGVKFKE